MDFAFLRDLCEYKGTSVQQTLNFTREKTVVLWKVLDRTKKWELSYMRNLKLG